MHFSTYSIALLVTIANTIPIVSSAPLLQVSPRSDPEADISVFSQALHDITQAAAKDSVEISNTNAVANVAKAAANAIKDAAGGLRGRGGDAEVAEDLFGAITKASKDAQDSAHAAAAVSLEQDLTNAVANVAKSGANAIKDAASGLRARGDEEDISVLSKLAHDASLSSAATSIEQTITKALADVAKNGASNIKDAAAGAKVRRSRIPLSGRKTTPLEQRR